MATEIPWQCWESPGFKSCHSKQWQEAVRLCELGSSGAGAEFFPYSSVSECVTEQTVIRALKNCASLCPQGGPSQAPGPDGEPLPGSSVVFKTGVNLSTNAKIMLAAGTAVIVTWLVARRK